jgi:hypothetical protein
MENKYKDFIVEDFEKLLTKEQRDKFEDLCIRDLGDGLYRLPGGMVTGIGGVEMFNQAVKRKINEYVDIIYKDITNGR